MYAGQAVEAAPVAQLLSQPRHPYTRALITASPSGAVHGDRLTAIPGAVPDPARRPAGCRFAPRCDLATDECRQGPVELITIMDLPGLTRCVHSDALVCSLWARRLPWPSCAT
jgi:oligopeptide/dipeptide ABC transporter ATP-binding protein